MLTEMIEYSCKIKEVKSIRSEIKENIQGANSEGKEMETQINHLEKEETSNQKRMKKQEFKKNEERLRNLRDNFKCSNIGIIGVPEGEEEDQEIENLCENIMNENFPNLAKEIDFQKVQEAHRVPKKLDPRKHTPRYVIITLPKIKDKEKS